MCTLCVCVVFVIALLCFHCFVQVENLVAIELAYINTKHPDFAEAYTVHRSVSDYSAGDSHRSFSNSSLTRNMLDRQGEEVKVGHPGCHPADLSLFCGKCNFFLSFSPLQYCMMERFQYYVMVYCI